MSDDEIDFRGSDSSAKIELEQLKSKIHALESLLGERTQELKSKDDILSQKEKVIEEKSNSVVSLQSTIASLQKKGATDAQEQAGKGNSRASELENQIKKLQKELEGQHGEKMALETRVREAEEKAQGLKSKLENVHKIEKDLEMQNGEKIALENKISQAEEKIRVLLMKHQNLQKINDEQKTMIRKTERALNIAEEELKKAKFEATSKTNELMEVHGSWLPPWLAVHFVGFESFLEMAWNENGKPAMDVVIQKALEIKLLAEKWAEPYVETVKTIWVPVMKEQWVVIATQLEPHVQLLSTKIVKFYVESKSAISPHVIKMQEIADPYFKEAKKISKPYIDHVASLTKPHVDKVRIVLKPYTKKVVHAQGKLLKTATLYHNQAQVMVLKVLKKRELTSSIATTELVWVAASVLLALPIILLFRLCSAIFCKKGKRETRNPNAGHARRKGKRGHSDRENAAR